MNRIVLAPNENSSCASTTLIKNSHDLIARARRAAVPQVDLPYATFAPMHYEERYAYPLLVWLHGEAGSEQELRQVMPLVSMRNYVAIAPRGSWTDERNRGRYGWRQTADSIECAESRIAECITVAERRFNIHAQRIFLVGRDSGGTMALRVAWNDPDRFAGVVSINGPLPTSLRPLGRVNELRRVPCLLTTSRDSTAYPESHVCRDLRLLHAAGCTIALRQYPVADDLTTNMLSDLNGWLMELVCGNSIEQRATQRTTGGE